MSTVAMYRVVQVATGVPGAPYYITGYFSSAAGTAQQAADAWRTFINPGTPFLRAGLTLNAISEVDLVGPETGDTLSVEPVNVGSAVGTSSDDPLPTTIQALVRWRTGVYTGGREIRGRTSIPGLTESASTAGRPNTAYINAIEDRADVLLANPNAEHVVWSRKNGEHQPTLIASMWVEWAVLRSRRD